MQHHVDNQPLLVVSEIDKADTELFARSPSTAITRNDIRRVVEQPQWIGYLRAESNIYVRVLQKTTAQHALELRLQEHVILMPSEQRLAMEVLEVEQSLSVAVYVLHPGRLRK